MEENVINRPPVRLIEGAIFDDPVTESPAVLTDTRSVRGRSRRVTGLVTVSPAESATWNVTVKAFAVVVVTRGLLEITPVAGSRTSPEGNADATSAQVYGGVPPVAARVEA